MERLTLSFSTVECARCGARRQTRFPCADCGEVASPAEIDINVQARQRAVQDAASARSGAANRLEASAAELLESGGLAALPKRVFDAADRLARGEPDAPREFAGIAQEIASLERWADDVDPLRPMITLTHHTQSVVRSLVQMYDVVAAALVEERLDQAQQAADTVQSALDAASALAAEANDILERANRVLEATDPMGAWVAEAFASDPIAATAHGQALVEAHTGRTAGSPSALAAVFYEVALSTIGDPDEFWRLVREHLQLFDGVTADILAMVSDPMFTSRAIDVTHDLWDAARRAAVAPEVVTPRAAATELLEAGHLLVEQPLKFHLGVACAATTRMTFADTQASDVSQLIKVACDKGWEIRSGIGDAALRNAFAHRDFDVTGDKVSLSPQRRRRNEDPEILLPLDHVQNGVLRLVETLTAMDLALAITMDGLGVSINASPLGRFLAGPLLVGLGWSEIQVADDEGLIIVSAITRDAVPLRAMAFVAQPFAGSAKGLLLRLARADTSAEREIKLDIDAYSAWAYAHDELEKEAMFVRMGRTTLLEGQPMFSDAHVEKFLAFRGCQVLVDRTMPDREVARQVNLWRGAARDLGLKRVNRQLGKGLRLRIQAGAGMAFDPDEFDDLLAIAGKSVPALPDSLI